MRTRVLQHVLLRLEVDVREGGQRLREVARGVRGGRICPRAARSGRRGGRLHPARARTPRVRRGVARLRGRLRAAAHADGGRYLLAPGDVRCARRARRAVRALVSERDASRKTQRSEKRLERKSTTTENSCRETDATLKDAHEGGTTPPGAMGGVAEEALPVIVPLLFLGAVAFTLGAVTLACFAINGSGDGVSGAWRADELGGVSGKKDARGRRRPAPRSGARGGARFHGWFSKQTSSRGELDRALAPGSAPASPSARARLALPAQAWPDDLETGGPGRGGLDACETAWTTASREGVRDGRGRGARFARPGELDDALERGREGGDVGEEALWETSPAPLGGTTPTREARGDDPPSPAWGAPPTRREERGARTVTARAPLENRAYDDVDAMEGGAFGTPPAPPPGTPRSDG